MLGAVAFIAAVAWGGYILVKDEEEADSIVWEKYDVVSGSARRDLLFRGILQSSRSVPVVAMTRGRITELAKQGAVVKKGDLLCQIDDTNARESIENQETNLNTTELSLEQLRAQYALMEFQENNNVKQCQARLEHAILEEKEELAAPDERERRLMAIDERLAVLDVEDAEDAYKRELRMFEKKYITASALEPYQRSLENAKATLEELILKNQITRKGATEERRVELRKAVERAQANLDRVGLRRKRRLDDIKAQIAAEEKSLATINFSIKHSQEEIDNAAIYAPADGVFMLLTYRDWTSGGLLREITVGDDKNSYDVIGHIIDPADMVVKLVVNEADFSSLKENMPVTVTMLALPGKKFYGKIRQLGAIGKDRSHVDPTAIGGGESEVVMFNASIDFTGDGTTFHPGMSAMISVNVEAPRKGLYIPREAVQRNENGEAFVYKNPEGEKIMIKGRDFNEMVFLVEDGLEQGGVIYIRKVKQK